MPENLKVSENNFDGLLQFFYCSTNCSHAFEPFSESHVLRIVKKDEMVNGQMVEAPENIGEFPFKRITGWEEKTDYITSTEIGVLDEAIDHDTDALEYIDENYDNIGGEKLFGWPHWVQAVDYPECRKCKR